MIFRIENIELKNVRNIEKGNIYTGEYLELLDGNFIEFTHHLCLFGLNGSGKTTALMALDNVRNLIRNKTEGESLLQKGKENFSINITFYLGLDDESYLVTYNYTADLEKLISENIIIKRYDFDTDDYIVDYIETSGEDTAIVSKIFMNPKHDVIKQIKYQMTNRFFIYDNAIQYIPYRLWGYDRKDSLLEKGYYNEELDSIINCVNRILLPIADVEIQLTVGGDSYFTQFKHKDYSVRYDEESGGIKRLAGLLLCLIPLATHSDICVCIDEIENSLFDRVIVLLLELTDRLFSGQIIMTSHQFSLIDFLSSSSVFFAEDNTYKKITGTPILSKYEEHLSNKKPIYYNSSKLAKELQKDGNMYE